LDNAVQDDDRPPEDELFTRIGDLDEMVEEMFGAPPDNGHVAAAGIDPLGVVQYDDLNDYEWEESAKVMAHRCWTSTSAIPKSQIICDFNIEVPAIIERPNGEPVWIIRLTGRSGMVYENPLTAADRKNTQSAVAWLNNISPSLQITVGKEPHLLAAIKRFSVKAQIIVSPETAGWHMSSAYGPVFVMPGMPFGIGRDGRVDEGRLDQRYLGRNADVFDHRLVHYGKHVRVADDDAGREVAFAAFARLTACAPPNVAVLAALAILGAPLRSHGLATDTPIVEFVGLTGSRKTSYLNTWVSIFGDFAEYGARGKTIATWARSSEAFFGRLLELVGDLPLMLDDYKVSTAKQGIAEIITQTYVDNAGAGKNTRESHLRADKKYRAMLITSGEQSFAREPSAISRVWSIPLNEGTIDNNKLLVAQMDAGAGRTQVFGGEYLKWLAGQSAILEGDFVARAKHRWTKKLRQLMQYPNPHAGVVATTATLLSVADVLLAHVRDVYPAHADEIKGWLNAGLGRIGAIADRRAEEVGGRSPARVFFEQFQAVTRQDKTCFTEHVDPDNADLNLRFYPDANVTPKQQCIARHREVPAGGDELDIFFTEETSFEWFRRRHRGEQLPFDWRTLSADMIANHGGRARRDRVSPRGGMVKRSKLNPDRGVYVRLSAIEAALSS